MSDTEYIKYVENQRNVRVGALREEARHWRKALFLACNGDKDLVKKYMRLAEMQWNE